MRSGSPGANITREDDAGAARGRKADGLEAAGVRRAPYYEPTFRSCVGEDPVRIREASPSAPAPNGAAAAVPANGREQAGSGLRPSPPIPSRPQVGRLGLDAVDAPSFDPDWARPGRTGRRSTASSSLQVVPCLSPAGRGDAGSWKQPRLADLEEFAERPSSRPPFLDAGMGPAAKTPTSRQMGCDPHRRGFRTASSPLTSTPSRPRTRMSGGESLHGGRELRARSRDLESTVSGSGGRTPYSDTPRGSPCRLSGRRSVSTYVARAGSSCCRQPCTTTAAPMNGRTASRPWQTDLAVAPEWLIVAIEKLIRQHGGTGKPRAHRLRSRIQFLRPPHRRA